MWRRRLCYYKALQMGAVAKVVAIGKFGMALPFPPVMCRRRRHMTVLPCFCETGIKRRGNEHGRL